MPGSDPEVFVMNLPTILVLVIVVVCFVAALVNKIPLSLTQESWIFFQHS